MIKKTKGSGGMLFLTVLLCMMLFIFPAQAANVRQPAADGTVTYGGDKAVIDASHASDGYLMIRYTGSADKIKIRIKKDTEYTYDLNTSGQYETFPLTEGSGTYAVQLYEHLNGNQYTLAVNQSIPVSLTDERSPFLYPNQFCNFNSQSAVVAAADNATAGITDTLKKVEAIYSYAVNNISYDYQKAATVQSGYLPNVDTTLAQKTGICFDYASLMTAMLRVEDIPSKLVIGYSQDTYHAWVSVYTDEQGWIDNLIYFDGSTWRFMDPTFASSGKGNSAVGEYIANPANYRAKFTY